MSVKPVRPLFTRRSIIAAGSGLALAATGSKFSSAQPDDSDMPDAADAMIKIMPQAAPPITFTSAKGKPLTLANYHGQVLVVNLWATWCGPCTEELPTFAALAPQLKAINALVLPISIDINGADAVKPFYATHGIRTLPILLDPEGSNLQVLNSDGIPITIVIDATGKMVARLDGAANWNTPAVMKYLRSLTAQPPSTTDGFVPA